MASAVPEVSDINTKYHKLAAEYSKLRAQAGVLKRAVLEEQNKNACLREQLRIKDANFRRLEQEADSLGFRNKQLEHRVATLQDDLDKEGKKKGNKNKNKSAPPPQQVNFRDDPIFSEELTKKIFENAQLTSLLDDRNTEIQMYLDRIRELEEQLNKKNFDFADMEKRLKREIENIAAKNADLERRNMECMSTLGSEDGLSVTGSEYNHVGSSAADERIAFLEKELNHWWSQFEVLKISQTLTSDNLLSAQTNGPNVTDDVFVTKTLAECNQNVSKEQLMYSSFSRRFEAVLYEKCLAESKVHSVQLECENLQHTLEVLREELDEKNEQLKEIKTDLNSCEDNLSTTRENYEEKISVMTEQIISLSDQLANRN